MANLTYPQSCYFQDGTKDQVVVSAYRQLAIERLATYEDTGLEPEEIKELSKREKIFYDVAKRYTDLGEYYHLLELVQAEKDGRLVMEGGKDHA